MSLKYSIENANTLTMDNNEAVINLLLDIQKDIEKERQRFLQERQRLPYQMNVIDELHINENANSRILTKLFLFQSEKGEFEILHSFLDYLRNATQNGGSLSNIEINEPEITCNKDLIDIWVRDKTYAIIIENKIYNAKDQEAQLARYIDKTINTERHYDLERIFVIYMPPEPHDPEDQTWKNEEGRNYKSDFQSRYFKISFKEDVHKWLKLYVLPNIRKKDVLLLSAVTQYIDYLEGIFGKRLIDKEVNMETKSMLVEKLALNQCTSIDEKIKRINDTINGTSLILNSMEELKVGILSENMKDYIRQKGGLFKEMDDAFVKVCFVINQVEYQLYVSKDTRYYCQLWREGKVSIQNEDSKSVYEKCKEVLTSTNAKENDRMWIYTGENAEEAFECFRKVFDLLCENFCIEKSLAN